MRLACRPVRRIGPQPQPVFIGERSVGLVGKIQIQLDHILRGCTRLLKNCLKIGEYQRRLFSPVSRIVIGIKPLAKNA